jgi:hypothetical protein
MGLKGIFLLHRNIGFANAILYMAASCMNKPAMPAFADWL